MKFAVDRVESMTSATPFHDLEEYIALPRLGGLALSPDGTRLIATLATLSEDRTKYTSALWEIDPTGQAPARRITRHQNGESAPVFSSNGDLYFSSSRQNPETGKDEESGALWQIPAAGGEARVVLARLGGLGSVSCAKDADVTVIAAQVFPGAANEKEDADLRKQRKDRKVSGILHSSYPVRYWDHDLGPGQTQYFQLVDEGEGEPAGESGEEAAKEAGDEGAGVIGDNPVSAATAPATARVADKPRSITVDTVAPKELRRITHFANELLFATPVLSPDGTTIATALNRVTARAEGFTDLALIDITTGNVRRIENAREGWEMSPALFSPDGATLAITFERTPDKDTSPSSQLGLLDIESGQVRTLAEDWDRWGWPAAFSPDGSTLYVTADEDGATPIFAIDLATQEVRRLTSEPHVFTDVRISPDGGTLYALRSSYEFPAEAVRVDASTSAVTVLNQPAPRPEIPGTLERITTAAQDNTQISSYLVLPSSASANDPAPLLVWAHGGPLGSWNNWSWRWNPWIMAARGYAVLLPDPAFSTGYGQNMVDRGFGQWGGNPYTDIMAATDAALERADIDETRIGLMGGSYGGYMANWVAGHTDRFAGIVSHASVWEPATKHATADVGYYWRREFTPERIEEWGPNRHVANINTPMLVIHGAKDFRVPISEGNQLWFDLIRESKLAMDENGETPHRFLYFPDENHWILTPQNARIWYGVVENFMGRHVLGQDVPLPEDLGL